MDSRGVEGCLHGEAIRSEPSKSMMTKMESARCRSETGRAHRLPMGGMIWKCLRYRSLVLVSFSCGLCGLGCDASVNPLGCLLEEGEGEEEKEMRWVFCVYLTVSSYFICRLIKMTQRFFSFFFSLPALVFAVRVWGGACDYLYYWCWLCGSRSLSFLFYFYIRAGFIFFFFVILKKKEIV